jgi:hypothetical protein
MVRTCADTNHTSIEKVHQLQRSNIACTCCNAVWYQNTFRMCGSSFTSCNSLVRSGYRRRSDLYDELSWFWHHVFMSTPPCLDRFLHFVDLQRYAGWFPRGNRTHTRAPVDCGYTATVCCVCNEVICVQPRAQMCGAERCLCRCLMTFYSNVDVVIMLFSGNVVLNVCEIIRHNMAVLGRLLC